MVESRCGCICSKCEYKESANCPGCLIMDKPIWGDSCDLKSCCEAKNLEHCGLCPDFPCETMVKMAAGDIEHYNYGCRMENCRTWARTK